MKKSIKKIAVALICIITVISFTSVAFAGTPCDQCGGNTILVSVKDQYDKLIKPCPVSSWYTDCMDTWSTTQYLKCTNCGYKLVNKFLGYTYTSTCNAIGGWEDNTFEVRKGWNMTNGYDIHCSLDYWLYGIMN